MLRRDPSYRLNINEVIQMVEHMREHRLEEVSLEPAILDDLENDKYNRFLHDITISTIPVEDESRREILERPSRPDVAEMDLMASLSARPDFDSR